MKKAGLFFGIILIAFAVVFNCCEKEEDNLPPVCNIEIPSDSSEFSFGDTIIIKVKAVDINGSIKIVLFYIDDVAKFSTSSVPYQFKWIIINETAGYHIIRASAFDREGNSSSDECIIKLVINPPVVITADVSSVTNNSAKCGGNVTSDCGATVTARGVCWSIAPNPTLDDAKGYTTDSAGTGPYISYLTGLSRATKYYIRAYATNSEGTSYGEQVEFITKPTSLAITTYAITNITNESAVCGGEITDDGGLPVTARGVCWNTTGEPTLSDNYITIGTGTGTFSCTITGLSNKAKYYIRAYATNSMDTTYGNTVSFTTNATLPEVSTTSVSSITSSSAQSGGNVTDDGGVSVTDKGVCWSTSSNPTISDYITNEGSETGSFISYIKGLKSATTYYVRAYATNSIGTVYGNQVKFTTNADLPNVSTTSVSSITTTSAQSGGNVTDDGGASVIARGVCWSTSSDPTISDYRTIDGNGTGSFTSSITGLEKGTTYYVRAYATNSIGTAYGKQVKFTTDAELSTVITTSLSSITSSSAQIGGYVTDDGGATVTARGVCYSTTLNPTISDYKTNDGTGTGSFISSITGLESGTIYYVRAYATNNVGTAYGDELNFTTKSIIISWQKSLGGGSYDGANSIQQTTDGGYIIAGVSWSNDGDVSGNYGNSDCWIVKLTSSGEIDWQRSLGGSEYEGAYSIQQTTDGGYIFAGESWSDDGDVSGNHGAYDYWIVKLTSTGKTNWQKSLGGSLKEGAHSIRQTTDGGYIIDGSSPSSDGDVSGNHGDFDYWIVKLTSSGEIAWQKSLGGSGSDWTQSITQTTDGGYIIAGSSYSNDGDVSGNNGVSDYWIVKLTSTGEIDWQKSLGGSSWEGAYSIQQTTDGGYIIAGYSESNDGDVSGNHGKGDYWIVKLTSSGEIDWQKSLGGSEEECAKSIQQTTDGGYIIAGYSYSNDGDVSGNHGDFDYWIVKLTSKGEIDWKKSLGGSWYDYANSIQQTTDGGYIISGISNSHDGDVSGNHGDGDYWIVKISEK